MLTFQYCIWVLKWLWMRYNRQSLAMKRAFYTEFAFVP